MTPREAASAVSVATQVRVKILAGEYDAKGRAPSRADMARDYKISLANASVVLRMLAAEGWITLDQGRGSFLRPRRLFRVDVAVARPAGATRRDGEEEALLAAIEAAEPASPAVAGLSSAGAGDDTVVICLDVIAVSPARAAEIAEDVIWSARGDAWSWDGWDLAGASVSARPA
jgi:DNA-binding GntR family transcriptional regulator